MFLIFGLIALVIVGFFLWRYFASYESTDDAQIDGHVNSISARVSGHVISLNVQDNQYVEAGTLLAEIDPADYQVSVQRAQADYDDAKATADAASVDIPISSVNTTSQLSPADADVRSSQAGIKAPGNSIRQHSQSAAGGSEQCGQNDLARYKQLVEKQKSHSNSMTRRLPPPGAGAAAAGAARATADALQAQVSKPRVNSAG
jgi:membrane fusion protein (multidrug efflux system)